jgi:hypothetical protein
MKDIEGPCQFVFEFLWRNMGIEGVETKENQSGVENRSSLWSFPDQKPLPSSLPPNVRLSLMVARPLPYIIDAGSKIIENENRSRIVLIYVLYMIGEKGFKARGVHRVLTPSLLSLSAATTGRKHLNEENAPLITTGIGERYVA